MGAKRLNANVRRARHACKPRQSRCPPFPLSIPSRVGSFIRACFLLDDAAASPDTTSSPTTRFTHRHPDTTCPPAREKHPHPSQQTPQGWPVPTSHTDRKQQNTDEDRKVGGEGGVLWNFHVTPPPPSHPPVPQSPCPKNREQHPTGLYCRVTMPCPMNRHHFGTNTRSSSFPRRSRCAERSTLPSSTFNVPRRR